ncbi:MAG: YceI family protein [Mycobacterium sp.]
MEKTWTLTNADGELTVKTGVAGRAARMGHRLTLRMDSWRIAVTWKGKTPVAAELVVDVDSLQVQHGEGGVTPLSGPEKGVARGNGLKTLDSKRFPTIEYRPDSIESTAGGYRLSGPLTIHGVSKPTTVDVTVSPDGDSWQLTCSAEVRQTDFKIKPFSMMMGTMKVDDVVTVALDARATAPDA